VKEVNHEKFDEFNHGLIFKWKNIFSSKMIHTEWLDLIQTTQIAVIALFPECKSQFPKPQRKQGKQRLQTQFLSSVLTAVSVVCLIQERN